MKYQQHYLDLVCACENLEDVQVVEKVIRDELSTIGDLHEIRVLDGEAARERFWELDEALAALAYIGYELYTA